MAVRKIFILGTILLGGIALSASAEITFVNQASAYERIEPTTAEALETSLTVPNFTAGDATDTYLVISVVSKMKHDPANPILSTTFQGVEIPSTASTFVQNDYTGWVNLFIVPAQGAGDVEVTYKTLTTNSHDAISISVASYSGVAGVGAIGNGSSDNRRNIETLSGSITTTRPGSLIVSSIMASGHGVPTMTGVEGTIVRVDNAVDGMANGLLEMSAPSAGTYTLGTTFLAQFRASMISTELLEK